MEDSHAQARGGAGAGASSTVRLPAAGGAVSLKPSMASNRTFPVTNNGVEGTVLVGGLAPPPSIPPPMKPTAPGLSRGSSMNSAYSAAPVSGTTARSAGAARDQTSLSSVESPRAVHPGQGTSSSSSSHSGWGRLAAEGGGSTAGGAAAAASSRSPPSTAAGGAAHPHTSEYLSPSTVRAAWQSGRINALQKEAAASGPGGRGGVRLSIRSGSLAAERVLSGDYRATLARMKGDMLEEEAGGGGMGGGGSIGSPYGGGAFDSLSPDKEDSFFDPDASPSSRFGAHSGRLSRVMKRSLQEAAAVGSHVGSAVTSAMHTAANSQVGNAAAAAAAGHQRFTTAVAELQGKEEGAALQNSSNTVASSAAGAAGLASSASSAASGMRPQFGPALPAHSHAHAHAHTAPAFSIPAPPPGGRNSSSNSSSSGSSSAAPSVPAFQPPSPPPLPRSSGSGDNTWAVPVAPPTASVPPPPPPPRGPPLSTEELAANLGIESQTLAAGMGVGLTKGRVQGMRKGSLFMSSSPSLYGSQSLLNVMAMNSGTGGSAVEFASAEEDRAGTGAPSFAAAIASTGLSGSLRRISLAPGSAAAAAAAAVTTSGAASSPLAGGTSGSGISSRRKSLAVDPSSAPGAAPGTAAGQKIRIFAPALGMVSANPSTLPASSTSATAGIGAGGAGGSRRRLIVKGAASSSSPNLIGSSKGSTGAATTMERAAAEGATVLMSPLTLAAKNSAAAAAAAGGSAAHAGEGAASSSASSDGGSSSGGHHSSAKVAPAELLGVANGAHGEDAAGGRTATVAPEPLHHEGAVDAGAGAEKKSSSHLSSSKGTVVHISRHPAGHAATASTSAASNADDAGSTAGSKSPARHGSLAGSADAVAVSPSSSSSSSANHPLPHTPSSSAAAVAASMAATVAAGGGIMTASRALAAGVDIRTYIPRSGATGVRFTDLMAQQQQQQAQQQLAQAQAELAEGEEEYDDDEEDEEEEVDATAPASSDSTGGAAAAADGAADAPFSSTASDLSSAAASSSSTGTTAAVSSTVSTPVSRKPRLLPSASASAVISSSSFSSASPSSTPAASSSASSAGAAGRKNKRRATTGGAIAGGTTPSAAGPATPAALAATPAAGSSDVMTPTAEDAASFPTLFPVARAMPKAPIGLPHTVVSLDRETQADRKARLRLENSRAEKWRAMFKDWDSWMTSKHERVKKRCRKGVPEAVRGLAWYRVLGTHKLREERPNFYRELLSMPISFEEPETAAAPAPAAVQHGGRRNTAAAGAGGNLHRSHSIAGDGTAGVTGKQRRLSMSLIDAEMLSDMGIDTASATASDSSGHGAAAAAGGEGGGSGSGSSIPSSVGAAASIIDTIERDINRTFPQYSMFSEVGGIGQTSLFRVLVAYAQFDHRVGYCQGMGFLAALILSYMPEEDAFWLFFTLMTCIPHKLNDLYSPGLPRLNLMMHVLQGLINTKLPKLSAHFGRLGLHPTMYAAQWILTIFTYNFPFSIVVRIWDAWLFEGWKIVFRVALAVLKHAEPAFLRCEGFDTVMEYFRDLPGTLDPDSLMKTAFDFPLKGSDLQWLEEEYLAMVEAGLETCGADTAGKTGAAGVPSLVHKMAREKAAKAAAARARAAQAAAARGR